MITQYIIGLNNSIFNNRKNCYFVIFGESWNYDKLGPDYWKVKFKESCGIGHKQSPINILNEITTYDKELYDIKFNLYESFISLESN